MVVTISTHDRCLWLYTATAWAEVEKKLVALPTMNNQTRRIKQMLIGHADDCEMDGNGRLLLPATLREFAGFGKKLVLVGQGDKYEIWDAELWAAHQESFLAQAIDESDIPPELASLSF